MISISVTEKASLMKAAADTVKTLDGIERSKALDMFEELTWIIGSDEDTTINIFNRAAASKFVPGVHPFETVYSDAKKGILVTIAVVNANGKELYVSEVTITGDITALTVKANSLDEIEDVLLVNGIELNSMNKER